MKSSAIILEPTVGRRSETHAQQFTGARADGSVSASKSQAIFSPEQDLSSALKARLSACLGEVASVAMYFERGFRERLIKQFKNLFDEDDWDETDNLVDGLAARTLVRALVLLDPKERPLLALGHSGTLSAVWLRDEQRFVLECDADDRVQWFVYKGSHEHDDRAVGKTVVCNLPPIVEAFSIRQILDGQG